MLAPSSRPGRRRLGRPRCRAVASARWPATSAPRPRSTRRCTTSSPGRRALGRRRLPSAGRTAYRAVLTTDVTLSAGAADALADTARERVADGFTTLKMKVGPTPPPTCSASRRSAMPSAPTCHPARRQPGLDPRGGRPGHPGARGRRPRGRVRRAAGRRPTTSRASPGSRAGSACRSWPTSRSTACSTSTGSSASARPTSSTSSSPSAARSASRATCCGGPTDAGPAARSSAR